MKKSLVLAALVAVLIISIAVTLHMATFGTSLSINREHWGQFGDYFGGLLNPIFAFAAFMSALWSINVQRLEVREMAVQLTNQTAVAKLELEELVSDRRSQEFLLVVRDIDVRLAALRGRTVSVAGTLPVLNIDHMASEAERVSVFGGFSPVLDEFVRLASERGSVIESDIREIQYLLEKLRQFLEQYASLQSRSYAPVLIYYVDKASRLLYLMERIGGIHADTRKYFADVSHVINRNR